MFDICRRLASEASQTTHLNTAIENWLLFIVKSQHILRIKTFIYFAYNFIYIRKLISCWV